MVMMMMMIFIIVFMLLLSNRQSAINWTWTRAFVIIVSWAVHFFISSVSLSLLLLLLSLLSIVIVNVAIAVTAIAYIHLLLYQPIRFGFCFRCFKLLLLLIWSKRIEIVLHIVQCTWQRTAYIHIYVWSVDRLIWLARSSPHHSNARTISKIIQLNSNIISIFGFQFWLICFRVNLKKCNSNSKFLVIFEEDIKSQEIEKVNKRPQSHIHTD